jgi:hypothetical protein
MAEFVKSYKAKGVLSIGDMELTETKKEGIFTHDLESALRQFEGQEVTISIAYKEEIQPKDDSEDKE